MGSIPLTRRSFLAAVSAAPALAQRRRPNLVFVMTDDHSPWAISPGGCSTMHTPHIAALARSGTRFANAFACTPVCSPSRLTWLTGQIPSRHGVQDWLRPVDSFGPQSRRFLDGLPTWSEALARAGYTLGLAGKWHMGHDDRPHAGFSWWATIPGGGGPYQNPTFYKNGKTIPMKGFKTDLVGDAALEFLDTRKGQNHPFALYLPFYAPHTPYNYQPDQYRAPYEGSDFPCFPRRSKNPRQNPGLAAHHGNPESMRGFSALVTGADSQLGRVVEKLKQMGVYEDTVIVFTSDQGWSAGHHGVWGKGNGTWPFNMYDTAIGVPLIWAHPGKIAAGRVESTMVSSYDFLATLLDYLGIANPHQTAGLSYADLLRGRRPSWQRDTLFFEYSGLRGLRTERWKYLERDTGEQELYDLREDAHEERNLASKSAQTAPFSRTLTQWFARQDAPPLKDWRSSTTQTLTSYALP
ncbi:MAG: sulfatase-like hydrolase/transferase [Bryobacteraceae bacterium]|nr:sulfatase-like hydrolase/transferase [Bryobacteraceae bacterium]